MALETSEEKPAPLRTISGLLNGYISRLGAVWIEAEVVQPKLSGQWYYFTLCDLEEKVSASAMAHRTVFESTTAPVTDGTRVVVEAKTDFYVPSGRLTFKVSRIRPAGQGELLAELEKRKRLLAAEGLFEDRHKRPIPVLPGGIGLITGKGSAAERDVLENISNRWAAAPVRVRHALMQGPRSAGEVIAALAAFDADPNIDVIIIARGGGSLEDLLPFSDEGLVRAVFAATTPVISAIGHEPDIPILDLVADLRASTPTDAAKRVVPEERTEREQVLLARDRVRSALATFIEHETRALSALRSRPVLTNPAATLDIHERVVGDATDRARRAFAHRLHRANDELGHQLARIRALSPLATLDRGYAIVAGPDGTHVSDPNQLQPDDAVSIRVTRGRISARVTQVHPNSTEDHS